jgi:hypothetical protein
LKLNTKTTDNGCDYYLRYDRMVEQGKGNPFQHA